MCVDTEVHPAEKAIEEVVAAGARVHSVILAHVGEQAYAIDLAHVERIVPMAELSVTPQAPRWLSGFLNMGGQALPVVSLGRLFGLEVAEPELYTPLLVLRDGENRLILCVERVTRIVLRREIDLTPIPSGSDLNDCAVALISCGDETALLISVEKLFLLRERKAIGDLQELAQRRLKILEGDAP